jgi:hypothetical protein
LLCARLAASSDVEEAVVVSMCRVSAGTDLIVPFAVFEKDGECGGGLFWILGFAPPFRVFMTFEEMDERVVLAGALIVLKSILKL